MPDKLEELQAQIDALTQKREALLQKERDAVLNDINAKIKLFGLKPKDLHFGKATLGVYKAAPAPKYKKGTETWSGRGRKPKWVEEHLKKGGSLDEFLIKT